MVRRLLVEHHEQVVATSTSADRVDQSRRAIVRLREQSEEADRLRRINQTLPPASTLDGQLQRWREAKADDRDLEVVWNGAHGRAGAGLSSYPDRR